MGNTMLLSMGNYIQLIIMLSQKYLPKHLLRDLKDEKTTYYFLVLQQSHLELRHAQH